MWFLSVWVSNAITDFTNSKVKWITVTDMPENLTSCANLRPVDLQCTMCTITFLSALSPWRWHSIRTVTDCDWVTQSHSRFRHGQRPLVLASTGNSQLIGLRSLFTAMSIYGAYFMKACVQRIKRQLRWSDVNAKSQDVRHLWFNPSLW